MRYLHKLLTNDLLPLRLAALSLVGAFGLSLAIPVVTSAMPMRPTNRDRSVTSGEVRQALQNTDGVLAASAGATVSSDADSALVSDTSAATVDVPKDARRGIKLSGKDGSSISVSLPNAANAATASRIANGVVSYPSTNGSANAVQTNSDGSVRMLTVIDNPSAPTRYDYTFSNPVVRFIKTQAGEVVAFDAKSKVIVVINRPWAKDAAGNLIRTSYSTKGTTLTQHVDHRNAKVVYPVTADPDMQRNWLGMTIWFKKADMKRVSSVSGAAAALVAYKFPQGAAIAGSVAWAANEAQSRGYCLAIYKTYYYGSFVSWLYRC